MEYRALIRQVLRKTPVIFLGSFLCALSVPLFVEPAGLLAGGCSGIGLVLHHFTPLPTAAGIWGASIGFFIWGLLALGAEFALNALVGAVSFPLSYNIAAWIVSRTGILTDDVFLCMIFAGILTGVGIGIVLRIGASEGATDVPAIILNRKLGIPVSVSINVIDGVILCLQMSFSEPRRILYGLLYVMVYSVLSGKVITYGQDKIQVQIISAQYERINRTILHEMDHGSTLVPVRGGFAGQDTFAVQTVVGERELFRVREAALRIDPQVFMVINPVLEVDGRGFTLKKQYGGENANSDAAGAASGLKDMEGLR